MRRGATRSGFSEFHSRSRLAQRHGYGSQRRRHPDAPAHSSAEVPWLHLLGFQVQHVHAYHLRREVRPARPESWLRMHAPAPCGGLELRDDCRCHDRCEGFRSCFGETSTAAFRRVTITVVGSRWHGARTNVPLRR